MTMPFDVLSGEVIATLALDRARLEIPHPRPFICRLTVSEDQTGRVVPHVSNDEFVRWLSRVAELHARTVGYPYERLAEDGVMWFVGRHEIDYLAEVSEGDKLVLATWVRDMRRVKSWRDYVIYRPRDDKVVCRAATLWVLVDLETRRPRRVPSAMAEAFEPIVLRP